MIRQIIDLVLADLRLMELSEVKPNYAAIGRKYDLDPRTVKKYHMGYKGKPKNRDKSSKLDGFKEEIADKLSIKRTTIRSVYEFMCRKHGEEKIGSYSNFKTYVKKHKLKDKEKGKGHPRYETDPGDMIQVDWKEDIPMVSRKGEILVVNILHLLLKFSRYSYLEVTLNKDQHTLFRAMINGFKFFGGVSKRLLFDNMSTAANISVRPKIVNDKMKQFAKEVGFAVQLCKTRSPETKGSNEARNKILDWVRPYNNEFDDFEDLVRIVDSINTQMNMDICQATGLPPSLLYQKEKEHLNPLPKESVYQSYLQMFKVKVADDSMIPYKGSRYSVDPKLIGESVEYEEINNQLHIYYKGKFITLHEIRDLPFSYHEEHYKALMIGKADTLNIDEIARKNLEAMDAILKRRDVSIDKQIAITSMKAMEAYLCSFDEDRFIIRYYAGLSEEERNRFFEQMKVLLPLIKNETALFKAFRFVLKKWDIEDLLIGVWLHEFENHTDILSEEGFFSIDRKYSSRINEELQKQI